MTDDPSIFPSHQSSSLTNKYSHLFLPFDPLLLLPGRPLPVLPDGLAAGGSGVNADKLVGETADHLGKGNSKLVDYFLALKTGIT